jgi:lysozyme
MDISNRGLDFIKQWESFRAAAYYDQAGIPTIGYGTICYPNGQRVQIGQVCTHASAAAWLRWDCRAVEAELNRLPVSMTQNMFDALASFCYNVGVGGFRDSTLRRNLVAGQEVLEDYFVRWNKVHDPKTGKLIVSNGLTRRRKAEFAFFIE